MSNVSQLFIYLWFAPVLFMIILPLFLLVFDSFRRVFGKVRFPRRQAAPEGYAKTA